MSERRSSWRFRSSVVLGVLTVALAVLWIVPGRTAREPFAGVDRAERPAVGSNRPNADAATTFLEPAVDELPREVLVDEPGAQHLEVRVYSTLGVPLESAEIWAQEIHGVADFARLGETDVEGILRVAVPTDATRLIAAHPQHASREHWLPAGEHGFLEIELEPAASISGHVVDANGARVATRPWILAHRDGRVPTKLQVLAAMTSAAPIGSADVVQADEQGWFSLSRLENGGEYALLVGGAGYGAPEGTLSVAPALDIQLTALEAFGAHLEFVDSDDGPLKADAKLWWPGNPTWTYATGIQSVGADSLLAILMGVRLASTGRALQDNRVTVLCFSAEVGARSVGPLHIQGTLIGYEPLQARVDIPRYLGEVPRVPVAMNSKAVVRGSLRIRFEGCSTRARGRTTRGGEIGRVVLRPDGSMYTYSLHEWGNGDLVLQGLPAARYEVTLESDNAFVAYEPRGGRTIDVGSVEAQVTFDLGQSTELELLVHGEQGSVYTGPLSLDYARQAPNGKRGDPVFAWFTSAPYVLQGLLPRTYSIVLYKPFYKAEATSVDLATTLDEHRRATLTITR